MGHGKNHTNIPPTRSLAEFLEDDGKQTPSKKKGVPYCTKDRLIQMVDSVTTDSAAKKIIAFCEKSAENLSKSALPDLELRL